MKNWLVISIAAMLPLLPMTAQAEKAKPGELEILGYIEKVRFENPAIELNAKLDSGATTSSINALNRETFEKDGKEWIRFDVIDPEDEDNLVTFEAPVVRTVRIRRHNGPPHVRPVVELSACVGHVLQVSQFSLADRSDFNYQVLIGRNFMKGHIVVDSGSRFETKPECKPAKGDKG
jgi:hypothetical protein